MKPTLYKASETEFTSNGLGRLSDAISCKVTEERNGSYELEMVYPMDGIHFDDIAYANIIYAKPSDGADEQPFRIYEIVKQMNGQATIRAEHISYRMSEIPVVPFEAEDVVSALQGLSQNAVEDNPFEFWTDKSTVASFSVDVPDSMRALLGGQQGSILDVYGGEWEFDGFTARLWNQRGSNNGVTIRYGKNLVDLSQEESIASTCTGIFPYWKESSEEETDGTESEDAESEEESSDDTLVILDEKIIYTDNADSYPYKKTRVYDFSSHFQSEPTQEQLRSAAESYIKNNSVGVPKVSLTVSFLPIWQTEEYKDMIGIEHIKLCDTVTVEFEKLGVSASAKVTKTVYDVLLERYDSIELGDSKSTLADSINSIAEEAAAEATTKYATKSALQKSVDRATQLITGGLGGYVVIKLNADGQPEELLILGDDPDYTVAQQVWRWNKNGLGYSSTGYTGDFRTAITSDGHISADFIDVGTLTATLVKAGLLSDAAGINYWNMETGELSISAAAEIGGKTAETIAEEAVDAQTQESIFNKLTNNGETQGIYLKDGILYINASYINTGELDAGLITSGTYKVVDSDGNVVLMMGADVENGIALVSQADGVLYPVSRSLFTNPKVVSCLCGSDTPASTDTTGTNLFSDVGYVTDQSNTYYFEIVTFNTGYGTDICFNGAAQCVCKAEQMDQKTINETLNSTQCEYNATATITFTVEILNSDEEVIISLYGGSIESSIYDDSSHYSETSFGNLSKNDYEGECTISAAFSGLEKNTDYSLRVKVEHKFESDAISIEGSGYEESYEDIDYYTFIRRAFVASGANYAQGCWMDTRNLTGVITPS